VEVDGNALNVVVANKLVNGITETKMGVIVVVCVIVIVVLIFDGSIKNLENLHCENEYEKNKYGKYVKLFC
jgi:hypothetical protein